MEVYIGGYAQGKLTYVRKKYPGAQIYDENSWQLTKSGMCTERVQADKPGDRDQEETDVQGDNGRIVICNHLHRIIAAELAKGKTQAEILAELLDIDQRHDKVCFICDEIGNGIVPIEKAERDYREVTGRILTELAEQAETVVRILCGLGQCIKSVE